MPKARSDRLVHFYRALLAINRLVVRVNTEDELYQEVCRVMVELGGMAMAWIGLTVAGSALVSPAFRYGAWGEYLDRVVISRDAAVPEGCGPTGRAFREGTHQIENDWQHSDRMQPWLGHAVATGWRASASFPILRAGRVVAVLGLYHTVANIFDDEMVLLAGALSEAVSFALDNLDHEAARHVLESRMKLSALVFEHSSQPMMVTNHDNLILSVNAAYERMTGYSQEALRGRDPRIFNSGCHDRQFYDAMWQAIRSADFWEGRVWSRRKSGDVFPVWLTINGVRDADGVLTRYVSTASDITETVRFEETVWKQANFDLLTGLPNRYMLSRQIADEIERKSAEVSAALSLLYIDLDHFKEINDTLGHHARDLLLVEVARRISQCAGELGVVSRLGGDEFAVVMLRQATPQLAGRAAHCIIDSIAQPFVLGEDQRSIHISTSVGIAHYPADAASADDLLKKAEQAMYDAKASGRNRLSTYTLGMQELALERLALLQDLRRALTLGQFHLKFQPVVEMSSGRIVKAEALIRWLHPDRGLINPAVFIPLAEESGLIIAIGDWVFREAALWVKRVMNATGQDFQISVNMSPVQFRDEGMRVQSWLQYLLDAGVAPHNVVAEITEGLLMDLGRGVAGKLIDFRNAGIQVALDDFGTGYSSLSYLRKYDIDFIKIDQSFVSNMTEDPSDAILSEAIIAMAHKLGIKVIAEGVETREQHELLLRLGCDYGQGFWYARPLDEADFALLLQDKH